MDNEQRAGASFMRLYERYSRFENRKFLCDDIEELTLIEIKTIIVIGRREGKIKMSEIANQLGVTSGTPTVTIDRLIKKGYVDRVRDEEDRRQVFVALTEKGTSSFEAIVKTKNDIMTRIFGIVNEAELEIMIQVLERIEGNLERVFQEILEARK